MKMRNVLRTSTVIALITTRMSGTCRAQELELHATAAEGATDHATVAAPTTSNESHAADVGTTHLYKSGVSIVSLGVTVTDSHDATIPGLVKEDFAIFEDGRPQELRYFAAEPTPLDLAILLDTSASMYGTLQQVQHAALHLAGALRPGDRVSFTEVKRGMRELHPLSSDTSGLSRAIESTTAGGSTALYDAMYVALRTLDRAANPTEVRRQALVILSDGDDTASLLRYDDVLDAARRHGVTVYGVSLRMTRRPFDASGGAAWDPSGDRVDGDVALRTFAQQTGGQAFFNLSTHDLAPVCRRIANELAHQYSLGYVSNNPREDGSFRLVSVRIVSAPAARARTRTGYFADSKTRNQR